MKRTGGMLLIIAGLASGASVAWAADGETIYKKACATCHDEGLVGSPKLGNQTFWRKRVKQGKETLYRHAIEGFRYMPPRGGVATLTDGEVKSAVDYMLDRSNACPVFFFC